MKKIIILAVAFGAALIIGGHSDYETTRAEKEVFSTYSTVENINGQTCVNVKGDYFAFDDDTINENSYVSVTVDTHGSTNKHNWTIVRVCK